MRASKLNTHNHITRHYSIHAFFRQMPNALLARYFAARGVLADFDFSGIKEIKDDDIFTPGTRKKAGHQISRVQVGLEPDDWKPFDVVGTRTKEIRINLDDGWFRVMYVAKFPEAVYVLHCFTAVR